MTKSQKDKAQPVRSNDYLPKAGPKSKGGGKKSRRAHLHPGTSRPTLLNYLVRTSHENAKTRSRQQQLVEPIFLDTPHFRRDVFMRAEQAVVKRATKDGWPQAVLDASIKYLAYLASIEGASSSRSAATKGLARKHQENVEYYFTYTTWCRREKYLWQDSMSGLEIPSLWTLYQSFFEKD